MSRATASRGNNRSSSTSHQCPTCGTVLSHSRRSSNSSVGRASGGRSSLHRHNSLSRSSSIGGRSSRGNSALAIRGVNQPDLNFSGLMATIAIMNAEDAEYEGTVEIFLSSRYQNLGPFLRDHKDSQLISKEQWIEYWSVETTNKEHMISAEVAGKIFDTCSFLAKGRSGITPTALTNLQKTLPRVYRTVTSSGAGRQLSKFSWYRNGQEHRDIKRPSQILSPQKYEELIARLRADNEDLRAENAQLEMKIGEMEQGQDGGSASRDRHGPKGCACPCAVHEHS